MSVQSLESCMSLNCIGIFLPVYVVLHVVRSVHLSWVKFFKSFKTFKYRFRECGFAQITYFAPVKLVFVLYINTIIFLANISRSTICQYFKSDPARKSWIQPCSNSKLDSFNTNIRSYIYDYHPQFHNNDPCDVRLPQYSRQALISTLHFRS